MATDCTLYVTCTLILYVGRYIVHVDTFKKCFIYLRNTCTTTRLDKAFSSHKCPAFVWLPALSCLTCLNMTVLLVIHDITDVVLLIKFICIVIFIMPDPVLTPTTITTEIHKDIPKPDIG